MRPIVLAVDVGQSAVKVHFGDAASLTFPGVRAGESLLPQVARVVNEVAALGDRGAIEVGVGAAALSRAHDKDALTLLELCRPSGVVRVSLTSDSVTSFLGAIGDQRGVVVAAGTGMVVLGVGEKTVARVDGWGNVMGDAGSGFWIGRQALDAVMRAFDGRGPATALTEAVKREFPRLDDAYMELLTNPDFVRVVASFSREVADAAASDRIAAEILVRAGKEIAHSAATAVRRIGEDSATNPVICLTGGVLGPGPVLEACVTALGDHWPDFTPYPASGDALAGRRLLPGLSRTHPLAGYIAVASTAPGIVQKRA